MAYQVTDVKVARTLESSLVDSSRYPDVSFVDNVRILIKDNLFYTEDLDSYQIITGVSYDTFLANPSSLLTYFTANKNDLAATLIGTNLLYVGGNALSMMDQIEEELEDIVQEME